MLIVLKAGRLKEPMTRGGLPFQVESLKMAASISIPMVTENWQKYNKEPPPNLAEIICIPMLSLWSTAGHISSSSCQRFQSNEQNNNRPPPPPPSALRPPPSASSDYFCFSPEYKHLKSATSASFIRNISFIVRVIRRVTSNRRGPAGCHRCINLPSSSSSSSSPSSSMQTMKKVALK